MEGIILSYYKDRVLPDTDYKELCEYLLSTIFPSDKVDVLDGYVSLKSMSPFPIGEYGLDYSIVEAARVSIGAGLKDIDRDKRLIDYMRLHRHTSPFEHMTFTFIIKCPIFVARHIMRHRTFSFNEISARYAEVEEEYYVPTTLYKQHKVNRQCSSLEEVDDDLTLEMDDLCKRSFDLYHRLLSSGVSREQARMILPVSTYTTFMMTGNYKNYLHFLSLRDDKDSQSETQMYAKAIHSIIEKYTPLSK